MHQYTSDRSKNTDLNLADYKGSVHNSPADVMCDLAHYQKHHTPYCRQVAILYLHLLDRCDINPLDAVFNTELIVLKKKNPYFFYCPKVGRQKKLYTFSILVLSHRIRLTCNLCSMFLIYSTPLKIVTFKRKKNCDGLWGEHKLLCT